MRPLRRAAVVLATLLLVVAGCQDREPASCDAEDRQPRRDEVEQMSPATRDSIARAFSQKNRIQRVDLAQEACHFRAAVRVDSLATRNYAVDEGMALMRVLKVNAPNETALLQAKGGMLGEGIYDYIVTFRRVESDTSKKPLTRMVKRYDLPRVRWTR